MMSVEDNLRPPSTHETGGGDYSNQRQYRIDAFIKGLNVCRGAGKDSKAPSEENIKHVKDVQGRFLIKHLHIPSCVIYVHSSRKSLPNIDLSCLYTVHELSGSSINSWCSSR